MSNPDGTFIYVGTYPDEASARSDYDIVKALHSVDAVGSFDAAVVTKDADGKVHVNKDETATRTGGWLGVGVGALVGILFPPAILGSAVVGGVVGGISGHLWKGMSRWTSKSLATRSTRARQLWWSSERSRVSKAIEKAQLHAVKETKREVDASFKELEKQIKSQ